MVVSTRQAHSVKKDERFGVQHPGQKPHKKKKAAAQFLQSMGGTLLEQAVSKASGGDGLGTVKKTALRQVIDLGKKALGPELTAALQVIASSVNVVVDTAHIASVAKGALEKAATAGFNAGSDAFTFEYHAQQRLQHSKVADGESSVAATGKSFCSAAKSSLESSILAFANSLGASVDPKAIRVTAEKVAQDLTEMGVPIAVHAIADYLSGGSAEVALSNPLGAYVLQLLAKYTGKLVVAPATGYVAETSADVMKGVLIGEKPLPVIGKLAAIAAPAA